MALLPDRDAAALVDVIFNKRLVADGDVAAPGGRPVAVPRLRAGSDGKRSGTLGNAAVADGNAGSIFAAGTAADRNGAGFLRIGTIADRHGFFGILARLGVDAGRQRVGSACSRRGRHGAFVGGNWTHRCSGVGVEIHVGAYRACYFSELSLGSGLEAPESLPPTGVKGVVDQAVHGAQADFGVIDADVADDRPAVFEDRSRAYADSVELHVTAGGDIDGAILVRQNYVGYLACPEVQDVVVFIDGLHLDPVDLGVPALQRAVGGRSYRFKLAQVYRISVFGAVAYIDYLTKTKIIRDCVALVTSGNQF